MSNEHATEVRSLEVHLYCDCGGEMQFSGIMDMCHPPAFRYTCMGCGKPERSEQRYPYIKYVPICICTHAPKQHRPNGNECEVVGCRCRWDGKLL